MMNTRELIETIVDCAMRVRSQLTPGFEEKIYKNAMFIELRDNGIDIETEVPFNVYYKDHVIGSYKADMIANRKVIIELKATNALVPINEVQLVNYLTATGINDGILINFGSEKIEIRHRTRLYKNKINHHPK
jgi:GxxExxY protein